MNGSARSRRARLRSAGLTALALAALTAGCGDGERFASRIGGGDTTTTATEAQVSPIQAAEAAARTVNLRATDFPYLPERERETRSSDDRRSEREFAKCAGQDALESGLASADSPSFSGALGAEFLQFSSNVEVFPNRNAAARIGEALRSPIVFHCFGRLLQPALEREESPGKVEIVSVRTARLPSPAHDVQGVTGFRVTATVAPAPETRQLTAFVPGETPDGRPTLAFYLDLLSFVSDRIAVSMTAIGSPRPVPADLEKNLLGLLEGRAQDAGERLR